MSAFEQAAQVRKRYNAEVARIRNDGDLTQSAKAARLAEAHRKVESELRRLQNEYQQDLASEQQRLRNNAFSLTFPTGATPGDRAQIQAAFHNAKDRASAVTNPADATRLLSQAQQAGDEALALAVAERAYNLGMVDVLKAHYELFPGQGRRVEALWDAEQGGGTASKLMASAGLTVPPRPTDAALNMPGTRQAAAGGDRA